MSPRLRKSPTGVRPRLHIQQILDWADAYKRRHGRWPTHLSGRIPNSDDESWQRIDNALRNGLRGLRPGSSLARLLARRRGHRNSSELLPLRIGLILAWADLHYAATGAWPNQSSGRIPGSGGENWACIEHALRNGRRGLPGGSSVVQLLEQYRGVPNVNHPPALTEAQILNWADSYQARRSNYPTRDSGRIPETSADTWMRIDNALIEGLRGLPRGSSLARLLRSHGRSRRMKRRCDARPQLTIAWILVKADAHYGRCGAWSNARSGLIHDAAPEVWANIQNALVHGYRGLPGGDTLRTLLLRSGRNLTHPARPLQRPRSAPRVNANHS